MEISKELLKTSITTCSTLIPFSIAASVDGDASFAMDLVKTLTSGDYQRIKTALHDLWANCATVVFTEELERSYTTTLVHLACMDTKQIISYKETTSPFKSFKLDERLFECFPAHSTNTLFMASGI